MEEMDEYNENIFIFVYNRSQTTEKPFKDEILLYPP